LAIVFYIAESSPVLLLMFYLLSQSCSLSSLDKFLKILFTLWRSCTS